MGQWLDPFSPRPLIKAPTLIFDQVRLAPVWVRWGPSMGPRHEWVDVALGSFLTELLPWNLLGECILIKTPLNQNILSDSRVFLVW